MGEDEKNEKDNEDFEAMTVVDPEKRPYPKRVFFILGNEFCERYCYYGMRTILVLYLVYYLYMDEDTATAVYHAFTVLAYLFPLMGAFIADSWLGKYKTILYLSVVYAIGMVLITLGAVNTFGYATLHMVLSMIGLFVIAVGTGGIKPCVSSFGGDQFHPDQEDYRRSFFSLFYFAINAGSLISTIVSPIIREDVHCGGREDCYALAFGIPAALMVVAIIAFVIGTPFYIIKAPEGNIFAEVFSGMGSAIKHRWNTPRKERKKEHWMDYALVDTSEKMVRDTKYVLRVLVLYIPLPFFWALFDQQGSRWTLQATRMNGQVGAITIKPDQMQVFNPLLIVTLIPLFEATLYPCLKHFNINFSPLRKMTLGMILAGISFILAALVQLQMDESLTIIPEGGQASVRIINSADCTVKIHSDIYPTWDSLDIPPGQATDTLETFVKGNLMGSEMTVEYHCPGYQNMSKAALNLTGPNTFNIIISDKNENTLQDKVFPGIYGKSSGGGAIFRVFNTYDFPIRIDLNPDDGESTDCKSITANDISDSWDVDPKIYTITVSSNDTGDWISSKTFDLKGGADYTIVASADPSGQQNLTMYEDVAPNEVNIFWMIPQYFVITLGEVFLSVTGLEFSYSQAPTSMKSVLASFWLLTVSIGNIIVLIIAEAKFVPNQADEYFLFAGLIFAATIVFVILAIRYDYVDENEFRQTEDQPLAGADKQRVYSTISDDEEEKKPPDSPGKSAYENEAFDEKQSTAL